MRTMEQVQEIVRHAARELTGCDGATFVLRDVDKCYLRRRGRHQSAVEGPAFPARALHQRLDHAQRQAGDHRGHLRGCAHSPRCVPAHVREEPGDGADSQQLAHRRHRQLLGAAPRTHGRGSGAAAVARQHHRGRHRERAAAHGTRAARLTAHARARSGEPAARGIFFGGVARPARPGARTRHDASRRSKRSRPWAPALPSTCSRHAPTSGR